MERKHCVNYPENKAGTYETVKQESVLDKLGGELVNLDASHGEEE